MGSEELLYMLNAQTTCNNMTVQTVACSACQGSSWKKTLQ